MTRQIWGWMSLFWPQQTSGVLIILDEGVFGQSHGTQQDGASSAPVLESIGRDTLAFTRTPYSSSYHLEISFGRKKKF